MKRGLLSLTIAAIMLSMPCFALAETIEPVIQYPLPTNNSYQTQNYSEENLRGNVVMVPAKTTFAATLMTPISSEIAKVGDNVSFYMDSDFYYGNDLIAPEGSRVNGTIIKVRRGTYGSTNGLIQIRFSNIITPSGQIIPITASIETNDGSGVLKAGTVKDTTYSYARDAVVGAASGAILGVIMGALSGGHVGRGAIYGTAVGGGMGLTRTIAERGDNVDIPQNAQFNIILDQPITISASKSY